VHDEKSFANALAAIARAHPKYREFGQAFFPYKTWHSPVVTEPRRRHLFPAPAFDPGAFAPHAFDTTAKVMLEEPDGKDLRFLDLAKSVRKTLRDFCTTHSVPL